MKQNHVRVRMYRQGLGDCFLLTFPSASGDPFHMLIDCGVVLGTPDASTSMTKVMQDVAAETQGNIDLLAVTHEHWDHVSGFNQAQTEWNKINVKKVWLAWTEDPKDALANKLRKERRNAESALRMAVNHLALGGDKDTAERVQSLVTFFGASAGSTTDALAYVSKQLAKNKARYCEPGEPPIEVDDLPGIRFWVLGPPKDEKLLKKSNPGKNDAYGLDAGPGGSQGFLISALTRSMGASTVDTPASDDTIEEPFGTEYAIPLARARQLPFFDQRYFGEANDHGGLYDRKTKEPIHDQSWRRVDAAWMGSSETLALQLDSATNNTSLVLAIELLDTGEVLLFPGDAQAGNWLSWQNLSWTIRDSGNGTQQVTANDLLGRTVFYKVGHHGSHNATLKDKGLELMQSDDLIAMIPVDHAMAVKKRWGLIPLTELVDRLEEKTHGRVLRSDDQTRTAADLEKLRPKKVSSDDWDSFTKRVTVTELYYEIVF